MLRKPICFFLVLLLLPLFFPPTLLAASEEYHESKKELSHGFYGFMGGLRTMSKGFWELTTSTGKFVWHGTRDGLQKGTEKAKETDQWLQKNLW